MITLDTTPPPMVPRDYRRCPVPGCGRLVLAEQLSEPHMVPGTIKPCASVVITRRRFTDDDVHDGDINAPYGEPEVHALTTTEGETFPVQAARLLASEGLTEFSSWPDFQPHGWYSYRDVSVIVDRGEREEASAHLYGFTEDERREVWERVHLL